MFPNLLRLTWFMKRNYYIAVAFFFLSSYSANAQTKHVLLSNPADLTRSNELIVFKRAELLKQFKSIGKDQFLSVTDKNGQPKIVQHDDLDKDGLWDEAVLLCTLKPKESVDLSLSLTSRRMNKAVVLAHVRHRRKNADDTFAAAIDMDSIPAGQPNTDFTKVSLPPFLTEGPAWENDKVGFRLYFDVRNGKDIWGKTTTKMMMDTVGANPKAPSYHHQADWGMDIYKVGSSLSAGALAISFPLKNGQDTLVRLGGKNMGKVIYEKIADGPLRAIFKLRYPHWVVSANLKPVSLTEEISIWGGQCFYQSVVTLDHAPAKAKLVTGFANLFQLEAKEAQSKGYKTFYSFGLQSENKDNMGLAVMVAAKDVAAFGKTAATEKDIKDSYLAYLKIVDKKPLDFRFYAAWEPTDARFKSLTGLQEFLNGEMKLQDLQPIKKWLK